MANKLYYGWSQVRIKEGCARLVSVGIRSVTKDGGIDIGKGWENTSTVAFDVVDEVE